MGVALGSVEEEVADSGARNVLVLRCHVREYDAVRYLCRGPPAGRVEQVLLAWVREAEKPEDGVGKAGEDAEPSAESGWFNLFFVAQLATGHNDDDQNVGATNLV